MGTSALTESFAIPTRGRRRRLPRFGLLTSIAALGLILILLVSVFAGVLAPHDPLLIYSNAVLQPPNATFLLGTDDSGRDILSRILFGMRNSVLIAALSVSLGTTVGLILGLISGYTKGRIDFVLQRLVEVVSALPELVAAIVVVAVLGPAKWNVALAIAIVLIPSNARVMRSTSLRVSTLPFCEAARAIGASSIRIMFRHVVPNCIAPAIVLATANFGRAVLAETSLGFLGLGVPPPEPSLGNMLSGTAQRYFYQAPWMAVFPGIAISLIVLCINVIGDAIRDFLDPRLRWRI